jgi:hypothetical protein
MESFTMESFKAAPLQIRDSGSRPEPPLQGFVA